MAVERYGDVVRQRQEAYATINVLKEALNGRDAAINALKAENARLKRQSEEVSEARRLGEFVMTRFPSLSSLEKAIGNRHGF